MTVPDGYQSSFRPAGTDDKTDQTAADAIDAPGLLDDVRRFVRRFVVLANRKRTPSRSTRPTRTSSRRSTARRTSRSHRPKSVPEKTRLLEALELLVWEPLPTANISDAALFRVIDKKQPTLLMDEVDAVFGRKSPREELRGILNAGYRQGATTHRMGGSNNTELQTFSVYCPKAFAGIGDCLPDTISDRAISIRLKRRTRNVVIERFRLRDVLAEGTSLRDRLAGWLEPNEEHLAGSRPDLPDELDDRAQDVWEPLLAVADLAGGDWPHRARQAALDLSTGEERGDDSTTASRMPSSNLAYQALGALGPLGTRAEA
jgi:Protein of unknown function (DUF3631)